MEDVNFPCKLTTEQVKTLYQLGDSGWKHDILNNWSAKLFVDGYIMVTKETYCQIKRASCYKNDSRINKLFQANQ
jgi:hypothetical protein